jgi:uncharacterized protein (TIGR02271 family)
MLEERNIDINQNSDNRASQDTVIPVIEEQVVINKKIVETGRVQVSKIVHENVDSYTIPTIEEHINVERVPKNIIVDDVPPAIRYEDDVMIIPVLKEVAVVEKRIMLVEELRVTKTKTEKSETHEVTLKKEEVEVNRLNTGSSI